MEHHDRQYCEGTMNVVGKRCHHLTGASSRSAWALQCAVDKRKAECGGDVGRCHSPELRALADERGRAPRPPGVEVSR